MKELERRLRRARQRWLLSGLITGTAWVLVAVALAWLVLTWTEIAPEPGTTVGVLWAVFGLGMLVVALLTAARTPSLQATARQADRHFGLHEVVSTALEVNAALPADAAAHSLRAALLRDAADAAPSIDPRELVPLGHGFRQLLPLLLAAIIVAAGTLLDRASPAVPTPTTAAVIDPRTQSNLSGTLQQVAEALGEEARRLRDPNLQALATAFAELATRLSTGSINLAEAERSIESLLGLLEATAGDRLSLGGPPPAGTAALGPGDARDLGELADGAPAAGEPSTDPQANAASVPVPGELGAVLARLEDLAQHLDAFRAEGAAAVTGSIYFDFAMQRPDSGELRLPSSASADGSGAPVGVAQRSTGEAGDAAGAGTQALEDGTETARAEFDTIADVDLPDAGNLGGERVQALGEPGSDAVAGVSAGTRVGGGSSATGTQESSGAPREAGAWRRERLRLDPTVRAAANRYFVSNTSPASDREAP